MVKYASNADQIRKEDGGTVLIYRYTRSQPQPTTTTHNHNHDYVYNLFYRPYLYFITVSRTYMVVCMSYRIRSVCSGDGRAFQHYLELKTGRYSSRRRALRHAITDKEIPHPNRRYTNNLDDVTQKSLAGHTRGCCHQSCLCS